MNDHIKQRLTELPDAPGVYLMKGRKGRVIYIGKALVLKNRVRSYFNGHSSTHRAAELMLPHVFDIDWILCDSELDALLLEANLVRFHKPRFNVRLKDDKHYPYIRVTLGEAFPRVKVVRRILNDGSKTFGPYTDVGAMRRMLNLIPKVFRIRDCDLKLPLDEAARPCLSHHIARCDAPCAAKIRSEDYGELVQGVVDMLEGRHAKLRADLEYRMHDAASRQDYEKAAEWKNRLADLQKLAQRTHVDLGDGVRNLDLLALARDGTVAVAVIMEYRQGVLMERRSFPLECALEQEETEIYSTLLTSTYHLQHMIPDEILSDWDEDDERNLVAEGLSKIRKKKVVLRKPVRGEGRKLLRLCQKNAEMLLVEQIARRQKERNINHSVEMLQQALNLPKIPRVIEGYDISHLGGTDTVASGVYFTNGTADKQNYRKYKIKSVEGIDDFASMREVIGRRFTRLLAEGKDLPDLLLIDGGKGQVEAAYGILCELGLEDQPVIGLAKKLEEIWLPGAKEPVLLNHRSLALKLLQAVRNESHRFAITFQKKSRSKHYRAKWLEEIPGIGPRTQELLLRCYRTRPKLLTAPKEEVEKLIGKSRAEMLYRHLLE